MNGPWPATRETGAAFLAAYVTGDHDGMAVIRSTTDPDQLIESILRELARPEGDRPEEVLRWRAELVDLVTARPRYPRPDLDQEWKAWCTDD